MKSLVLKIPGWVFGGLVIVPLIVIYKTKATSGLIGSFAMIGLSAVVTSVWMLSVADYFCLEIKSRKNMPAVYALVAIQFILFVLPFLFVELDLENAALITFGVRMAMIFVSVFLALVMMSLVRRVLYARSAWFLFLELVMPPFGMLSLTPAIQQWDNGAKS